MRFHPDEALFSRFARSAAVHGDWMLPGPLDKSPLSIYASGLSMHFTAAYITNQNVIDVGLRQGEFAARLPNVFASLVLIALTAAVAQAMYQERSTGLIAALFAALSPYLIAFSATTFTDLLMLLFMVAALLTAARGRPAWAGLWLAASVASKQQGIFYLPLIVGTLWALHGLSRRSVFQFAVMLSAGIGLLLIWDSARPGASIFSLASEHNDPGRIFAAPLELLSRLTRWFSYVAYTLGPGWMTAGLAAIGLIAALRRRCRIDLLLWGYIVGYLGLHWLLAFNTYDRYLLPVVPLLVIGTAQGICAAFYAFWHEFPVGARHTLSLPNMRFADGSEARPYRQYALILITVLGVIMLISAISAAGGRLEIGRDRYPRQTDIIALTEYLNSKPLGAIIYDHWLGWEIGYYIGAWSDKRRVYYPEPEILAQDALLNPDPAPRYLISPLANEELAEWLNALQDVDFTITQDFVTVDYVVYKLIPPWAALDA